MIGIVSYGTYVPINRIKIEDIALVWKKDPRTVERSLGVIEKAVPGMDEDAVSMAVEASLQCFDKQVVAPKNIGAIFVGSESHPYAVNPTSTIVGEFLGVGNEYLAVDLEFACKAATAGVQAMAGLLESNKIRYGLVVGSDVAQSKPHDMLEFTAGSASVAALLGKRKVVAELIDFVSFTSDTPDFWRRDGVRYPTHAGRFTGEPAYFAHVIQAARLLFEKTNTNPKTIDYCVFHMPNGKFPRVAAKRLGFSESQIEQSLVVARIGNPYTASAMLGFSRLLDTIKPNKTICMVSYGSGAGSDAFLWKTTPLIKKIQQQRKKKNITVEDFIKNKTYITYPEYLKVTKII